MTARTRRAQPAIDRASQISVWLIRPAKSTADLPHLVARARVEIGRLIRVDCLLLRVGDQWRLKLDQRGGWDFAPPAGRKIVRDAVVAAWEASEWATR